MSEELRPAAALMRIRAKSATTWDGNWRVHADRPGRVIEVKGDGWDDAIVASCIDYGGTENGGHRAPHIASWHPAVALAVADWLDAIADQFEPIWQGPHVPKELADALAVARAYLGATR
jgi:hypothetical protein